MRRSLLVLAVLPAVLPAAVLAGCAASPAASVSDPPALVVVDRGRPSAAPSSDFEPSASWIDGGARLALVTYGSSSCPRVPESMEAVTASGFTLRMKAYDGTCTTDIAPYRVVLERPAGVDPTQETTVRIVRPRGRDDVLEVPPVD